MIEMKNSALKALLVILILVLMLTSTICYLRLTYEKEISYNCLALATDKEKNLHMLWEYLVPLNGPLGVQGNDMYGLHYIKADENTNVIIEKVIRERGGVLGASISVDDSQSVHIVYSPGVYTKLDSNGNIVIKDKALPFLGVGWPLIVAYNSSSHVVFSCQAGEVAVFYAKMDANMSLIGNVSRLKLEPWAAPRYAGISITSNNTLCICCKVGEGKANYTEITQDGKILADNEEAKVVMSTPTYLVVKDRYGDLVYVGSAGFIDKNNITHKLTAKDSRLYYQKIDINGTVLTENVVMSPTLSYGALIMIAVLIAASVAIVVISIILIKRWHRKTTR